MIATAVAALIVVACAPVAPIAPTPTAPHPRPTGGRPYLGWSTWSLQALGDGRSPEEKQTAALVELMSDTMHDRLGAFGYEYINIDDFWWSTFDDYGRQVPDSRRFPDGIAGVAEHVHANDQQLGIYVVAGLPLAVYDADSRIEGTSCTSRDIAAQPLTRTNGWHNAWAIDWANPCAQEWINSRVDEFARLGVDFIKLDGVSPSTGQDLLGIIQPSPPVDNRGDVAAWRRAISGSGRPMWLTLSWDLSPRYADSWAASADAVRVNGDIECYCATLTKWDNVLFRFLEAPLWIDTIDRTGLLPDFDTLLVGDGARDGLTDTERRTVATLWAVGGSPWYLGDDLTRLDDLGIELLTDPDVLDLVRSGRRLRPISTTFLAPNVEAVLAQRQVWARTDSDGTATVAMFNLSDEARQISVPLDRLGLARTARAQDLWNGSSVVVSDSYAPTIPAHGSVFVKVSTP